MPQQESSDALIMLYVDTYAIQNYLNDPTNEGVIDCVFISSNWTDTLSPTETSFTNPNGKTSFITDVNSRSQIAWVGAVKDIVTYPGHYVLIDGITFEQNDIGINLNRQENGSGYTHIDGNSYGGRSGTTTYTINFSVGLGQGSNDLYKGFQVDPQLRMK